MGTTTFVRGRFTRIRVQLPPHDRETTLPGDCLFKYEEYFKNLLTENTLRLGNSSYIKVGFNPSVKWVKAIPDEDDVYNVRHYPIRAKTCENTHSDWIELFTQWTNESNEKIEKENSMGSGWVVLGTTYIQN